MQPREVVTAFLEYEGRVALFRRSQAVGSYRGRWAGISGSVEPGLGPREQVWKELAEETGLSRGQIGPYFEGRPLPVEDPGPGRRWLVHPFLLAVKEPERIRLDWEHTEMRWVRPEEIRTYDTVPQLVQTWERVAHGAEVLDGLRALRADREHGAAYLARRALEVLDRAAVLSTASSLASLWEELEGVGRSLEEVRPSMVPLGAAARRWLEELRRRTGGAAKAEEVQAAAAGVTRDLAQEMEDCRVRSARRAAEVVGRSRVVATASFSATVARALIEAAGRARQEGREFAVRVADCEGHGVRLAELLKEEGVSAQVFGVGELEACLAGAEMVLLGADALLPDGSVVNGAPSLSLARRAAARGVPLVVAADGFKRSAGEVVLEKGFERIPAELVARIVTEEGVA
ncbi:MAG: NUDIX domain-containing protein [Clostridia bacterium]|nr:NUDIX domain-containing protein [Clostridia bacterium]MDH7572576.1 NUDIX domain-containing protein [Clostridia bacterium]